MSLYVTGFTDTSQSVKERADSRGRQTTHIIVPVHSRHRRGIPSGNFEMTWGHNVVSLRLPLQIGHQSLKLRIGLNQL